MTVEEAIEAALFGAVRDLDVFDADRKAWPDVAFVPPAGESYLRVELLSNGNQRLFIKGSNPHRYIGILQLTVVSPLNQGPSIATRLAGKVAAEFHADDDFTEGGITVRIEKAPDVLPAFPVAASWNVVVSIRYESFASPTAVVPPGVPGLDFSVPGNSQYIPLI